MNTILAEASIAYQCRPFLEENSTMSDSTIFVVEVVLAIVAVPAIAALIIFFMRRRDRLLRSR